MRVRTGCTKGEENGRRYLVCGSRRSANEYYRTCTLQHGTVCLTGCKGGGEVTLRSMMRIENKDKSDSRISVFGEKRRGRKRQNFLGSWLVLLAVARRGICQADGSSGRFCRVGSWWQGWQMKKSVYFFPVHRESMYFSS